MYVCVCVYDDSFIVKMKSSSLFLTGLTTVSTAQHRGVVRQGSNHASIYLTIWYIHTYTCTTYITSCVCVCVCVCVTYICIHFVYTIDIRNTHTHTHDVMYVVHVYVLCLSRSIPIYRRTNLKVMTINYTTQT